MFMNSLVVLREFSGSHQGCEGAQDVDDVNMVSIVDHFPGGLMKRARRYRGLLFLTHTVDTYGVVIFIMQGESDIKVAIHITAETEGNN